MITHLKYIKKIGIYAKVPLVIGSAAKEAIGYEGVRNPWPNILIADPELYARNLVGLVR
jgi:hypothetical protein